MKSGKRHMTEIIKQPNQEKIRTIGEKETYKYLEILGADTIKQVEMKERKKEYLRKIKKLHKTKLYGRNLIRGINTLPVPLVRYSGPFLKRTREDLKQIDQRTRKLLSMHKAMHPWDDVDRLSVSRKKGKKGTRRQWRQRRCIDTTTRRLRRKARRKNDHSHQKQYWRHEN